MLLFLLSLLNVLAIVWVVGVVLNAAALLSCWKVHLEAVEGTGCDPRKIAAFVVLAWPYVTYTNLRGDR